jgi:hypothetical protein
MEKAGTGNINDQFIIIFRSLIFRNFSELKTLVRPVNIRTGIISEVEAGIQTASEPTTRNSLS